MATRKHNTGSQLEEVRNRFDHDFNLIQLSLLERAYPNGELFDGIIYPDGFDFDEEEPLYPMWSTLFESKDAFLSSLLKQKVNELAEIGIYLMQVEETEAMMFIQGCGYSFYDCHWIPLYRDVLKWVV